MTAAALTLMCFLCWTAPAPALHPPPMEERHQAAPTPASQAAEPPAAAPEDAAPAGAHDALLDRLEASASDLRGFTANVYYVKEDELLGRREIRMGELIYEARDGDKCFAILFDTTIIGRRRRDQLRHYVFDGQWLADIDHEAKQFKKIQIVPPGKQLDPLKLGEGPFPLPVGQPKADVLKRFVVSTIDAPNEGPLAKLKEKVELEGLLLVPKPGTSEARDYERVELFYDQETLLPVGITVLETGGDRKTVRLSDARRNPDLTAEQKQKLHFDDPDPTKWAVSEQPWRGGG